MINIPINSTLALRVNGGYEYQPGVIDATNAYVYDNRPVAKAGPV